MVFVAVRAVRPDDAPPLPPRGVPRAHGERASENVIIRFFTQPIRLPRFGRHAVSRAEAR
jgi:hypothetical protein